MTAAEPATTATATKYQRLFTPILNIICRTFWTVKYYKIKEAREKRRAENQRRIQVRANETKRMIVNEECKRNCWNAIKSEFVINQIAAVASCAFEWFVVFLSLARSLALSSRSVLAVTSFEHTFLKGINNACAYRVLSKSLFFLKTLTHPPTHTHTYASYAQASAHTQRSLNTVYTKCIVNGIELKSTRKWNIEYEQMSERTVLSGTRTRTQCILWFQPSIPVEYLIPYGDGHFCCFFEYTYCFYPTQFQIIENNWPIEIRWVWPMSESECVRVKKIQIVTMSTWQYNCVTFHITSILYSVRNSSQLRRPRCCCLCWSFANLFTLTPQSRSTITQSLTHILILNHFLALFIYLCGC